MSVGLPDKLEEIEIYNLSELGDKLIIDYIKISK